MADQYRGMGASYPKAAAARAVQHQRHPPLERADTRHPARDSHLQWLQKLAARPPRRSAAPRKHALWRLQARRDLAKTIDGPQRWPPRMHPPVSRRVHGVLEFRFEPRQSLVATWPIRPPHPPRCRQQLRARLACNETPARSQYLARPECQQIERGSWSTMALPLALQLSPLRQARPPLQSPDRPAL